MTTVVFRNPEGLKEEEVLNIFRQELEKVEGFKDDIEELVETYAKNIVDKFIVSEGDLEDTFSRQGDILIWKKGCEMYDTEVKSARGLSTTDRLVLQEGDSMTGDHRLVPLKNSKFTLKVGTFTPSFLKDLAFFENRCACRILKINKPFLIVHREHGNMALPAGDYMFCTQLNSETMTRMMD